MCCCRINAETLMANLFANLEGNDWVPFETLQEYLGFLSERFVTYVVSNFGQEQVIYCAEKYSHLYELKETDGGLLIRHGELVPNLEYFNAIYPKSIANYIENLTALFLKTKEKS